MKEAQAAREAENAIVVIPNECIEKRTEKENRKEREKNQHVDTNAYFLD